MEEIENLKRRIDEHERRLKELEDGPAPKKVGTVGNKGVDALARAADLTEEQLAEIIDFDADGFTILKEIPGKTEKQKTANAGLCILTTQYYVTGEDTILGSDLRKKLQWLGISTANMPIYLQSLKSYFLTKGKPRSNVFSYRITIPGIKVGLEMIKKLAEGDNGRIEEKA